MHARAELLNRAQLLRLRHARRARADGVRARALPDERRGARRRAGARSRGVLEVRERRFIHAAKRAGWVFGSWLREQRCAQPAERPSAEGGMAEARGRSLCEEA